MTLYDELVQGFIADLSGQAKDPAILMYQKDPVAWFVDRLGVREQDLRWGKHPAYQDHKWDGDEDPLALILEELAAGRDVGAESGTGTGKTFLGAGIVLWFLECFENSVVVTLAPKADQLKLHIWKEIADQWPKFKAHHTLATLTTLKLKMRGKETWAATGFPVQVRADENVATKAAGFHAEHMLFITEETQGIDEPIMSAVENTCTAPHNLRLGLGNPDHQQDSLHQFCIQPNVTHIRVSALDHPNLVLKNPNRIPGAVSEKKVAERLEKYGPEARLYRSRVRGICATESTESVLRWSWLKACARLHTKDIEEKHRVGSSPAMGVDVANSAGGDDAAIAKGVGFKLLGVDSFPCDNATDLGTLVNTLMGADGIDETNVGVDAVGVGAATMNELKKLGKNVQALHGSAAAVAHKHEEKFGNLRAQMYWEFRVDTQHGRIILPDDEDLFQELITPTWRNQAGKIFIEEKKELKKRLRRSPNKADAAVYWNWVRKRRASVSGKIAMVDF